jgi:hypothetical protein
MVDRILRDGRVDCAGRPWLGLAKRALPRRRGCQSGQNGGDAEPLHQAASFVPRCLPGFECLGQQFVQAYAAICGCHPEFAFELRRHFEVHRLIGCGGCMRRSADLTFGSD